MRIAVNRIHTPTDTRKVPAGTVEALAQSIKTGGQISPIVVKTAGGLVNGIASDGGWFRILAGRNRYAAIRMLGQTHLDAIVVTDESDLRMELVTIDENLVRVELSAAERAQQTLRRREIWEAIAKAGNHSENLSTVENENGTKTAARAGFVAETAMVTGEGVTTVSERVRVAKELGPDLDRVKGTALDTVRGLDALSHMAPAEREEAIARAEKGEPVTVGKRKPDAATKAPESAPAAVASEPAPSGQAALAKPMARALDALLLEWLDVTRQVEKTATPEALAGALNFLDFSAAVNRIAKLKGDALNVHRPTRSA